MSKIKLPHASGNSVSIAAPESNPASDRTLYLPSNADGTILTNTTPGCILQVKQTLWNTHDSSLSNQSFAALSGFTVDITPSATSSKMLITLNILIECRSTSIVAVQLTRGGVEMFVNEGGYRGENAFGGYVSMTYLDSPNTTNQVTYGVETRTNNSTYAINNYIGSGPSHSFLTVMEVAG